jgi:hypothetical protein
MKNKNIHIFQLLQMIKKRPLFYVDGDTSLRRLRSFLVGYEAGINQCGVILADADRFARFRGWLTSRLDYPPSTNRGWHDEIAGRENDDHKAYELFFKLLDEFIAQEGKP